MPFYQIAPRLRKLLPRLASSNINGDRLATTEAIERVLRSVGLDWHDLAAQIGQLRDEPPSLRDMAEIIADAPGLNDWETKFVADMQRLLAAGARLSPKQEQALRRCYARHGDVGDAACP